MSAPAASRRDRYGRRFYPVPHPETHEIHDLPSWTRLKGLLHSGGIETWKLKSVALMIARRADLQMLAADESNTYAAVKQALDANQNKANVGTAVHTYTEYIDAGTLVDRETVPPAIEPWLVQYERAKEHYGWQMVATEVSVYNLTAGYAGTADRFATINGVDGVVCVDLKTGEEVWAETALQLGAYSSAEGIWVPPSSTDLPEYATKFTELERAIAAGEGFKEWGSPRARKWSEDAKKKAYNSLDDLYWEEFAKYPGHRPMPEGLRTDIGYVIHLRSDKCELVPVKLDGQPSSYDAVKALCWIFQWQQREKEIVGEPLGGPCNPDEPVAVDSRSEPISEASEAPASTCVEGTAPSPAAPAKRVNGKKEKPPFHEPDPDVEWVVGRILALPDVPRAELAASWPEGIPTFKQSRAHTVEQLRAIDNVLKRIEAVHQLPFVNRTAPVGTPDNSNTNSTTDSKEQRAA